MSIPSPHDGQMITLGKQQSMQGISKPGEATIDIEEQEMDYDTIELKESNINATKHLKQGQVTFRVHNEQLKDDKINMNRKLDVNQVAQRMPKH